MRLEWSNESLDDLERLYEFLRPVAPAAAQRALTSLRASALRLLPYPRLGRHLEQFVGREVRYLLVGNYEIRYEIADDALIVLRIWHTREHR
jgi:plasmid stabilization system protein ParE